MSEDGSAVLFNVVLVKESDQTATLVDPLDAIQAKYSTGGTNFYMLGEPTSTADFKKISEDDLKKGETIGVIVAIIVLLIVFGSLIAGVTPIIMGIFAIGVAFGVVGLLGEVWRWSFFVPNLISMMGLAVGIDYSLFIVSRYREERQRGTGQPRGDRDVGSNREPGRLLQRIHRGDRARRACCSCRRRSSAGWPGARSSS